MLLAKVSAFLSLAPLLLLLLLPVAIGSGSRRGRSRSFTSTSVNSFGQFARRDIHSSCAGHLNKMFLNGSCNNGHNPKQGASHTAFKLLFTPSKRDPVSIDLPSPRLVSNLICDEPKTKLNRRGITEFWTYFGQILDHTIAETHTGKESMDIPIPADDKFFPAGGVLPFLRTVKMKTDKGLSPENVISSYVDASSAYGVSDKHARRLRLWKGGKMKMDENGYLPKTEKKQFEAGDSRANENPALQAMHTLFVREHNRVCVELKKVFPSWDDETMYLAARRIVTAEFQCVTFYEFVPAILGHELGKYTKYKNWVDGSISNEFATAIYRVGHTLINPEFTLYKKDGTRYTKQLRDTFFKTDILLADGIEGVLRGTLNTKAAEVDVMVTGQVRNFLSLGTPMKVDLVSLNIQRGRDHAIPSYNALRRNYGLHAYQYFSQITRNRYLVKRLQQVYGNDIERIDAWIGGLAEEHVGSGSLGPLFATAWRQEFTRMRDGNRHYFENPDYFSDKLKAKSITVQQLLKERAEGSKKTMRRIIIANTLLTDKHVPDNVFMLTH